VVQVYPDTELNLRPVDLDNPVVQSLKASLMPMEMVVLLTGKRVRWQKSAVIFSFQSGNCPLFPSQGSFLGQFPGINMTPLKRKTVASLYLAGVKEATQP